MNDNLPPLPPYAPEFKPRWATDHGGYNEDQMQAYARAAIEHQSVPDSLSDYELSELAHSANQEALSYGLSHDVFLRYFKTLRDKALAAAPQPQPVQEPVATVQCIHGVTIGYLEVMQPVGTKLYTSPQAAQPLSDVSTQIKDEADVCMRKLEQAGLHRYQIDRLSGQVSGLMKAYEIAQAHGIPKGTT